MFISGYICSCIGFLLSILGCGGGYILLVAFVFVLIIIICECLYRSEQCYLMFIRIIFQLILFLHIYIFVVYVKLVKHWQLAIAAFGIGIGCPAEFLVASQTHVIRCPCLLGVLSVAQVDHRFSWSASPFFSAFFLRGLFHLSLFSFLLNT